MGPWHVGIKPKSMYLRLKNKLAQMNMRICSKANTKSIKAAPTTIVQPMPQCTYCFHTHRHASAISRRHRLFPLLRNNISSRSAFPLTPPRRPVLPFHTVTPLNPATSGVCAQSNCFFAGRWSPSGPSVCKSIDTLFIALGTSHQRRCAKSITISALGTITSPLSGKNDAMRTRPMVLNVVNSAVVAPE